MIILFITILAAYTAFVVWSLFEIKRSKPKYIVLKFSKLNFKLHLHSKELLKAFEDLDKQMEITSIRLSKLTGVPKNIIKDGFENDTSNLEI